VSDLCLLCDMQPGVVAFAGSAICLSCAASRAEQSRLLGQASCAAAFDLGRFQAEIEAGAEKVAQLRARVDRLLEGAR
jgi:hypothetical protein